MPRDKWIQVRVTDDEKEQAELLAKALGLQTSQVIRRALAFFATRPAFARELLVDLFSKVKDVQDQQDNAGAEDD